MPERPGPAEAAREIVRQRFPDARAAWLGGGSARGVVSATSDLDITVLLTGEPAPFRESAHSGSWPVELFVHTESSLAYYRGKDLAERRPTMMRLVAESVVLVDTDGVGERLQRDCAAQVLAGPAELSAEELATKRYAVTDLLMDLEGCTSSQECAVVGAALWREAADLLLTGSRHWTGTGKWLLRELVSYELQHGSSWAGELHAGLTASVAGDGSPLVEVSDAVLALFGGRLFDGYRMSGDSPEPPGISGRAVEVSGDIDGSGGKP